jgi:transcriptional regulator
MYIPDSYKETNKQVIIDYIKHNPFGILITNNSADFEATHIPFEIVQNEDGTVDLTGHFASKNPQSLIANNSECLVIFNGPHSYISSSWYSHANVPTWNYFAIHAKGIFLKMDEDNSRALIVKQLLKYEDKNRIDEKSEKLISTLINSITCFKIKVKHIEMCNKMSQNRNDKDYFNIINQLNNSTESNDIEVAKIMKNLREMG